MNLSSFCDFSLLISLIHCSLPQQHSHTCISAAINNLTVVGQLRVTSNGLYNKHTNACWLTDTAAEQLSYTFHYEKFYKQLFLIFFAALAGWKRHFKWVTVFGLSAKHKGAISSWLHAAPCCCAVQVSLADHKYLCICVLHNCMALPLSCTFTFGACVGI